MESQTKCGRNWLVTKHFKDGYQEDTREWLESFYSRSKATYVVGQLEQGIKENHLHIQAFANFSNTKKLGGLKKLDNDAHYDLVVRDNGAADYCMKIDTRVEGPFEFGTKPVRRNNKDDWDEVRQNALKGDFDAIPSQLLIQHYSALTKLNKDNLKVTDCSHLRGIYIYGESGCGKSTLARDLFGDQLGKPFVKTHNKWWDGYKGEKIVIWDDIDPEQIKFCADRLKDYCDRLGVTGETKGGAVPLTHEFFIMTSQYPPEKVFTEPEMLDAMKRRCFFFHDYVEPNLGFRSQLKLSELYDKLYNTVRPNSELKIIRDCEIPFSK